MMTIKIEIGFGTEQENKNQGLDIGKAVWITALADSILWIVWGIFSLELFYGPLRYLYALPVMLGTLSAYLLYLIVKERLLIRKYGQNAYQYEFSNMGMILVVFGIVMMFLQSIFLR